MNQTAPWPIAAPAPMSWAEPTADNYAYLLVLRFAAVNLVAFALLGAAWMHGLVGLALKGDGSYLSSAMFVLFLVGLGLCGWRIVQTSRELNEMRQPDPARPSRARSYLESIRGRGGDSRALLASALRLKLSARLGAVRQIANALVLIGLIGTVVGFIVVLSGVDPQQAADVAAVGPMISSLVSGMGIALYTTLVGAILNIWLTANCHILSSGLVKLITGIVELGERHARA